MAINKVVLGERTLIDLSLDTATEADVAKGKYFHRSDGEIVEGTLEGSGGGGGGGGGVLVESDVNFYDYDGTLLYAYPRAGVMAMTELPEPPTHEGLTFQEWNWTLDEIKAQNGEVDVGATYTTDDGKTRLYISITIPAQKNVTVLLGSNVATTVTVNWGDGTGDEVVSLPLNSDDDGTGYFSHIYENIGDYVISLDSDSADVILGSGYKSVLNESSSYDVSTLTLRRVELGSKTNLIAPKGFQYMHNLETVVLCKNARIYNPLGASDNAFTDCSSLKSIIVPIGFATRDNVFKNCTALEMVSFPYKDNVSVFVINAYAFDGCSSLRRLQIPYRVGVLEESCLKGTALEKIIIPEAVTKVEKNAFDNNTHLKEIVIKGNPTQWEAFANGCTMLKSFRVPASAASLPANAFDGCKSLASVDLPEGMTSIGNYAFRNCWRLLSIHIPESVESIGTYAFYSCYLLNEVNIPNGVPSIGANAFSRCTGLTSLEIPPSVTTIGTNVFQYCKNLEYIDFSRHTAVPTLSGTNAFGNTSADLEIRVPAALYDEWVAATNWSNSSIVSKIVAV